jgi:DNA-directed RNA polymerase subunit RPC12/RpoP
MSELPIRCSTCDKQFMAKRSEQIRKPVPGKSLAEELGYNCPHCEGWEHSYYTNPSLDKLARSVETAPPGSRKKRRLSARMIRKYVRLQKRIGLVMGTTHGTSDNTDMAPPRQVG